MSIQSLSMVSILLWSFFMKHADFFNVFRSKWGEIYSGICGNHHSWGMKAGRAMINVEGRPYVAAGVLPVCGTKCLVMWTKWRGWELPGGKVEFRDKDLFETARRETLEETNGLCSPEKELLCEQILDYHYKYALFIVKVDPSQVLPEEAYGMTEQHTQIDRRVMWMKAGDLHDILIRDPRKLRILGSSSHAGRRLLQYLVRLRNQDFFSERFRQQV